MSDVEIFRRVNGYKLEKFIALQGEVQRELGRHADRMEAVASAVLTAHRSEGHSKISQASGKVDRYVILDDTRGQHAAMAIEYGRRGHAFGKGSAPSRGIGALAAALVAAGGR